MAFLAPVAAEVGGFTLSKVLPWVIVAVVILGLVGALWLQTGRLHNAQTALKTEQAKSALYKASADGWQAASAQRDGIIADQAAELTKLATDKRNAQAIADQTAATAATKLTDLQHQLATLKARANAHPDQVRPLGPIVSDVLDSLCGAGSADPAAACH